MTAIVQECKGCFKQTWCNEYGYCPNCQFEREYTLTRPERPQSDTIREEGTAKTTTPDKVID